MVEKSQRKECSFFVVRYVPNLVRDEALNIGLLLYSPQEKYLGCLFTDDFRRVKRLHPQADLEFLRELQPDFEQQIDEHERDLEGYLREMQESYSNLIQLTPPRTCFLEDPTADIQQLFARYVGERVSGPLPQDTRVFVKQRLKAALVRAGVWDLERFERRIPVAQWTHPGDTFAFDYGYKPNGVVKFIHALSLKRDAELAKVLVYTIDHIRRKEETELTAIHEDPTDPEDDAVRLSRQILQEGRVVLQPISRLQAYAAAVRRELTQ